MTRAEKELIITYSGQRYRWGQLHDCSPSRFIKDINSEFVEFFSAFDRDIQTESANNGLFSLESKKKTNFRSFNNKYEKKQTETPSVAKPNYNRKLKKIDHSISSASADIRNITEGVRVKHNRFGIGTVLKIEGVFPNTKALIEFKNAGTKNLLLKFAKLELVD